MTTQLTPVPYATVSCLPGGVEDDVSNSVSIDPRTFKRIVRIMGSAVSEAQLPALVRKRAAEHKRKVEEAQQASGTPNESLFYGSFRVMVRKDEDVVYRNSVKRVFTYLRYSLVYSVRDGHPVVQATYTVRIIYNLISTTRGDVSEHKIECVTNSASAHGESGSPFSYRHLAADDAEWASVIRQSYIGPYEILRRALRIMQVTDLTALRERHAKPYAEGDFEFPFTFDELENVLVVNTFGFRFITLLDPQRVEDRHAILYMMHSLYSSEVRASNASVSLGKVMNIQSFATRRSDRAQDYFSYDGQEDGGSIDHSAGEDHARMSRLAMSSAKLARNDPLTSVRLVVRDDQRHGLYNLDLMIPNSRYLHRLYKATEARDYVLPPDANEKEIRKIVGERNTSRDFWKDVAQRGFIIGVDANSYYLLKHLRIRTLKDLLTKFGKRYDSNYSSFCQKIMDDALADIHYHYWLSRSWTPFVNPSYDHQPMTEEDARIWRWLRRDRNAHLTLVQAAQALKLIDAGKITKDSLVYLTGTAQRWVTVYGYNPLLPLISHFAVLQNWFSCENLGAKFRLERKGVTVEQRLQYVRRLFARGAASNLLGTVIQPALTVNADS